MPPINMLLQPLRARIQNIVARALVKLVDDSKKLQSLQLGVLSEETRENVERFQQYGFTSVPLPGAEAVVLFVGGMRDHGLALAVEDRRHRLTGLQQGEVALYTDQGDKVVIERGGTVRVTAGTKVVVDAPLVELAGNAHSTAHAEQLNSAIATLASAISAAIGAMGADGPVPPIVGAKATAAKTAIDTAVATFQTAAASALSTKVKHG